MYGHHFASSGLPPGQVKAEKPEKGSDAYEAMQLVPGCTVMLRHDNGMCKVTHPTLGLGFVNTRLVENGAVVMGSGSAAHTVLDLATHQECTAAESMEAPA